MRAVAAPSQDETAVFDPIDDDIGARGAGLDLEGYRIDARHIGTRSSFDDRALVPDPASWGSALANGPKLVTLSPAKIGGFSGWGPTFWVPSR